MRVGSARLFVLLAVATVGLAQEFRATITGQVMDPSGGAVPGAAVTAVKIDTQQSYTAKSGGTGVFSLLYLLPGEIHRFRGSAGLSEGVL